MLKGQDKMDFRGLVMPSALVILGETALWDVERTQQA